MRTIRTALIFSSLLLVVSCAGQTGGDTSSSSSVALITSSSSSATMTHNVSYMGTVQALGATIYMQGTHKLVLDDGRFIILQSAAEGMDLEKYVGMKVQVRGSSEPTVEAGGTLLHVEEITSMESSSTSMLSSSAKMCGGIAGLPCDSGQTCVDNPNDSCDPANGGADCGGICVTAISSSSSSAESVLVDSSSSSSVKASSKSSSAVSSVASSVSSSVSSSVAVSSSSVSSVSTDAAKEQQIVAMAKIDYSVDSLWSQRYCTSHIGFCIPAYKKWYYKSFGAAAGSLWHVDFGFMDITEANQGVIELNLVSGLSAAKGGSDGQVVANGSTVTAYKDFDANHFEITGDARLKTAISYMISHIDKYAGQ